MCVTHADQVNADLLAFLKGVERRRKDSTRGEIVHLALGGLPASKIHCSVLASEAIREVLKGF